MNRYENSTENAKKFLSHGMHKETDANELLKEFSGFVGKESLSSTHTKRMSDKPTLYSLLETSRNLSEEDVRYLRKLFKEIK